MHDIRFIRDNPEAFDAALKRRGLAPLSASLLAIDERRLAILRVLETWRAKRKSASGSIHQAMKAGDLIEAERLKAEVLKSKDSIANLEEEERRVVRELADRLAAIPNMPLAEVPDGADEHDNVEHHRYGEPRSYAFKPQDHTALGEALGFMDFEAAAKMSGSRFVVLKRGLARLERAIGQFFLDVHTGEHGYAEVSPPLLVRDEAMFGTAQLPKFEDDQFFAASGSFNIRRLSDALCEAAVDKEGDAASRAWAAQGIVADLDMADERARALFADMVEDARNRHWLIPTAEVPLTNLVRESILDEKELPLRLTALTHCFRAEAGAAGRDTRGMIRQHQFSKVELVSVTTPEASLDEHERMLSCAEEVLKRLGLHYRVVTLCTGDMGFASQKTYDIEVWMPGQGEGGMYREISSCSVCGDFQARRMNARVRGGDGKPRFVHTLNGSGTAVGRAMIAVMETYQQDGGTIAVPEVLQPYMGGLKVIEKGS